MKMKAMQKLFILVSATLSLNALALVETPLTPSDKSLIPLNRAEVLPPPTLDCPPGSNCDPVAVVALKFPLSHCTSRLGPVSANAKYNPSIKKYDVVVSAYEITSNFAASVRCSGPTFGRAEIPVGLGKIDANQVNLIFATNGKILP